MNSLSKEPNSIFKAHGKVLHKEKQHLVGVTPALGHRPEQILLFKAGVQQEFL